MIVARDDPVEHRLGVLAEAGGVVEHLVEHHPQPHGVQGADHGPELVHPSGTLGAGQAGAVGALDRLVVPRVVAPVVRAVGHGERDQPLLLGSMMRIARTVCLELLSSLLVITNLDI